MMGKDISVITMVLIKIFAIRKKLQAVVNFFFLVILGNRYGQGRTRAQIWLPFNFLGQTPKKLSGKSTTVIILAKRAKYALP